MPGSGIQGLGTAVVGPHIAGEAINKTSITRAAVLITTPLPGIISLSGIASD